MTTFRGLVRGGGDVGSALTTALKSGGHLVSDSAGGFKSAGASADTVSVSADTLSTLRRLAQAGDEKALARAIESLPSNVRLSADNMSTLSVDVIAASSKKAKEFGKGSKDVTQATRNTAAEGTDLKATTKAGSKWSPVKYVAGIAIAAAAVTVTAFMLKKSIQGAANDGKSYNIISLTNKDSSNTTVICKYTPTVEPSGIVSGDSVTINGTGTFLDGNTYSIVNERKSHGECEFDASQRLTSNVQNKGTITLHTSFENHMDHQANNMNPLAWLGGLGEKLQELLGNLAVPVTIVSGILSCIICIVIIINLVRAFSR